MIESNMPMQTGTMYQDDWSHANDEDNLFREVDTYHYFQEKYYFHLDRVLETFAYCLLPNHFHFMLRVRPEDEIIKSLRPPPPKGPGHLEGYFKIN